MKIWVVSSPQLLLVLSLLISFTSARQCGSSQAGGTLGPNDDIGSLISKATFEDMLKHKDDGRCSEVTGFYTYDAFITAAESFSGFGTTGNDTIRKIEIAAFFGQTSHATSGGWNGAPDNRYNWGYCFKKEQTPTERRYYGRGPIQLTHDYNYRLCGQDIGENLLDNPDLILTNAVISFKSAIWFWMTPQPPKPSCHDVITGKWQPSDEDKVAGRVPGYGVTTNIINGGKECGKGENPCVKDRIGYYKRYCDMFGVVDATNLDCYGQRPYGPGGPLDVM